MSQSVPLCGSVKFVTVARALPSVLYFLNALNQAGAQERRPGGENDGAAWTVCSCCCHELRASARPRASRARRLLPFLQSAAPITTWVRARRCGVQVNRSVLSSLCMDFDGACCTVLAVPTVRLVSASGGAQGPAPTKRTARPRWHPRAGTQTGVWPSCGTRCARTPSLIRVGLETV